MNTESQNTQMRRGVLELCILSIIAERDAYASDIIGRLKDAKLIVVEGTLYPLLTRLKNDGLTVYRWEESKTGPPRKYHKVTENGLHLLKELRDDWSSLVTSVDNIINNHKQE
jgi:PadR family transcriptional regulator PadR